MRKLQIKTLGSRIGGEIRNITPVDDPFGEDGSGPCTKRDCTTTCLYRVECCCFYVCPSGGQWVCHDGYCPGTSTSC